jgi:hypothetical protein
MVDDLDECDFDLLPLLDLIAHGSDWSVVCAFSGSNFLSAYHSSINPRAGENFASYLNPQACLLQSANAVSLTMHPKLAVEDERDEELSPRSIPKLLIPRRSEREIRNCR